MRFLILCCFFLPPSAHAKKVYDVSLWVDGGITAASGAAALIPYVFGSSWIKKRCPCDPNEVNSFDRGAIGNHNKFAGTASDLLMVAAILTPPALDAYDLGFGENLFEDGLVYAETLAVAAGLVSIVKVIVQRPVPLSYSGDVESMQSAEGYRSFYSGHVTLSVAALSATSFTLTRRYQQKIWPWVATAGIGTAVGLARVAAGKHFYSDVIVGMIAGVTVGTAIPWLHAVSGGSVAILPLENGAHLTWGRVF